MCWPMIEFECMMRLSSCQAGKYADAFNEYTRAIGLNPHTPVYYSNRAIACIKLFRFEQVRPFA